jgi:hypothetical protein
LKRQRKKRRRHENRKMSKHEGSPVAQGSIRMEACGSHDLWPGMMITLSGVG